ncbi:MAG: hypothetical protein H0U52_04465 [Chloroflexi bacterium]|nr:hypothetical protein [Chloroflexota bacterium]
MPPPRDRPDPWTRRRAALTVRSLVATVLLTFGLATCGTLPSPTPTNLASPLGEARTIPQPDGSIRIEAVSARALPDQPYLFPVFTHCGFTANAFDFDGSFWSIADGPAAFAVQGGNPPKGIDNPEDLGVIVAVGPDQATWTSRQGIRLELIRGPSDVQVFGCD